MELYSSRNSSLRVSFKTAVSAGIAPDGGLFVPASIPKLEKATLSPGLSFQERSFRVLKSFLMDEFSENELREMVDEALTFPVPLVPFVGFPSHKISILELFHGPTLSFKDFGARTLAAFLKRCENGPGQTIFVATSGDTGSAVADAFSNAGVFKVALLFPENGVSDVQKRQLTLKRPRVAAFSVQGTFDDCQALVKKVFAERLLDVFRPGSANSINIGRLLPQMLYYIHAVSEIQTGPVDVCVPSGNLGNITSAWMAKKAGANIGKLIAAHNENHPFTTFLQSGNFTAGKTIPTWSNAMDVGNPSNFERLRVLLSDPEFQAEFESGFATNAETAEAMRHSMENGYRADPHTAVGLSVLARREKTDRPILLAATAHPAKFPDIFEAAGLPMVVHPSLEALRQKPHAVWNTSAAFDQFVPVLKNALSSL